MHMNDLNRFNIPSDFIIDWGNVERMLRERNSPTDREILNRYFPKQSGGAGASTTATGTAYDVKPTPKVGEQWWIKVPDQPRLELVTVRAITNVSVAISVNGLGLRDGRYERDYFKFVERLES